MTLSWRGGLSEILAGWTVERDLAGGRGIGRSSRLVLMAGFGALDLIGKMRRRMSISVGENKLGKALMMVRERLRKKA